MSKFPTSLLIFLTIELYYYSSLVWTVRVLIKYVPHFNKFGLLFVEFVYEHSNHSTNKSLVSIHKIEYLIQIGLTILVRSIKDEVQVWLTWHFWHIIVPVHDFCYVQNFFSQKVTQFFFA